MIDCPTKRSEWENENNEKPKQRDQMQMMEMEIAAGCAARPGAISIWECVRTEEENQRTICSFGSKPCCGPGGRPNRSRSRAPGRPGCGYKGGY